MSHMLPPDDSESQNTPYRKVQSSSWRLYVQVGLLIGIVILGVAMTDYLVNKHKERKSLRDNPYSHNGQQGTLGNGSSLGGVGSGAMDDVPTPESLSREIKSGGGMKVMISGPNGDEMRELTPEQEKAIDDYIKKAQDAGWNEYQQQKARAISKPVGGDNTEATPVGGAGGGN